MAATMNKMSLNRACQQLQTETTDLENRLQANIPRIEQDVANVVTDIKTMSESLEAKSKPAIGKVPLIVETMTTIQEQVMTEQERTKAAEAMYSSSGMGDRNTRQRSRR